MGKKKKKKKKPRIRPLAICVFRRGDKIFVGDGYDSARDLTFYRPIGGAIEFGERGHETIAREVMEEIEAEVTDLVYLGTLENIFTLEGKPGHEIVLVYDGRFVDDQLNDDEFVVTGVDDGEVLFDGTWKSLDFFRGDSAPPLYPDGMMELLEQLEES